LEYCERTIEVLVRWNAFKKKKFNFFSTIKQLSFAGITMLAGVQNTED
jgi:hypothetical protein